jgi:hypothetical protein
MKASGASLLFEQKGVSFQAIDAVFEGLKEGFEDGFVIARGCAASAPSEAELRYFFIIQGKPYTAAAIQGQGIEATSQVTSIEDFFCWYKSVGVADVEVYKADKKVLLCLLVRISYGPALSFTTADLAPEEVIENMEGKGKDAVIAVSDVAGVSELWHFVIFVGGKVAYTTLLAEDAAQEVESPADRLISYIMSADKGSPLLVEIYVDTKISPAEDRKEFEEGSITGQYLGAPELEVLSGDEPESEATVEVPAAEVVEEAPLLAEAAEIESEPTLEDGILKEEDFEELDLEAIDEAEETEAASKEGADSSEESLDDLLRELPEELPDEESFSMETLPDEFAEVSMEELSDTFEDTDEGELDVLESVVEDGAESLAGDSFEVDASLDDEPIAETLPEVVATKEDDLGEAFIGDEAEGFTLEDNSPDATEDTTQTLEDDIGGVDFIGDDTTSDDAALEATFDMGEAEEKPEELASDELASDAEDLPLEDVEMEEVLPETSADTAPEVEVEIEVEDVVEAESTQDAPVAEEKPSEKSESFTPLPIEDDMSQRQPKAHPLSATLTVKDGVVYTLGSITNIGKEDSSEIKLDGMLAPKKLAAVIRGKDSFKVVKKGGGKSALKVNEEKVDEEKELKDGDTIEAGSLSLKFTVLQTQDPE